MEELKQQIQGGKYNYDMIKGLNQNFKLSANSTTKQTFNLTDGWINFSKCLIGMTLNVTASNGTLPIFFQHCAMWDQIIVKSGQQTLFESINLAQVNKMLQMYRLTNKSGTNYLFQKRSGINLYQHTVNGAWEASFNKVGDIVPKQNINSNTYNLFDANTFKDFTNLGCTLTDGTTNVINYSVRLADICPFSICELDQDIYFKDGVQIVFLFNSINKICFQATADATGVTLQAATVYNQGLTRFAGVAPLGGGITVSDLTFYRAIASNPVMEDTYFYYPYIYQNIINNFSQVFPVGSGHKHICDLVSFFDSNPSNTVDQYNNCVLEHDATTTNSLPSIQIYCDGGIALQKCSANEIQCQMFLESNLPLERVPEWYSVNTELQYNAVFGAKYYVDNNPLTAPDCLDKQRSITVNTTYNSGGAAATPQYVLFSVFLKKLSYVTIDQPVRSIISGEDGQQAEQIVTNKVKTNKIIVS